MNSVSAYVIQHSWVCSVGEFLGTNRKLHKLPQDGMLEARAGILSDLESEGFNSFYFSATMVSKAQEVNK